MKINSECCFVGLKNNGLIYKCFWKHFHAFFCVKIFHNLSNKVQFCRVYGSGNYFGDLVWMTFKVRLVHGGLPSCQIWFL